MSTITTTPPLLVDILRDGEVIRTIELRDPRPGFIASFNSLGLATGKEARIHEPTEGGEAAA